MVKMAFGGSTEASSAEALKGALAEFITLFLFVFIGVGSVMSYEKIHTGDLEAGGLLMIAIAHGLAIAILVAATANISGGHVNPAVSLGLALAGKITVVRLLLYWVAQLLGAAAGAAHPFPNSLSLLFMSFSYLVSTILSSPIPCSTTFVLLSDHGLVSFPGIAGYGSYSACKYLCAFWSCFWFRSSLINASQAQNL